MLNKTLSVVLAGGVGSRLHPLTAERAKPAVPFGGKYRIIDFVLTNCHHSGLRRMLVLTQYKSHSLQKHLRDCWSIYNPGLGEYITPVPPQMRIGDSWYEGTANAVYQNLYLLERSGAEYCLILAGDHIYRMDYAAMLEFHRRQGADATVACMPVPRQQASSFGVVGIDAEQRITAFSEKPRHPEAIPGDPESSLASMGVYVFPTELLCRELKRDHEDAGSSHDFGKDILPRLIKSHRVYSYRFGARGGRVTADGYWRDVGTLDSYFDANMDLLLPDPPIDLDQPDWAIRGFEGQYPPARTVPGPSGGEARLVNSLLCSGAVVRGATVGHSILSSRTHVNDQAEVERCVLFEGVSVGERSRLRNCIVDKNVTIPPGEIIGYDEFADRRRFTVSPAGVVVVPRDYEFSPGRRNGSATGRPQSVA